MTEQELQEIVDRFKRITIAELYLEADKQAITLRKFIAQQVRAGTDPSALKQALVRDLREGGQIFGSFRSHFKATVKMEVENVNRQTHIAIQRENGVQLYAWVLDPAAQHCQDCLYNAEREPRTLEEWDILGAPEAGLTICGDRCRCQLVASGVFGEGIRDEAEKQYMEMIQ